MFMTPTKIQELNEQQIKDIFEPITTINECVLEDGRIVYEDLEQDQVHWDNYYDENAKACKVVSVKEVQHNVPRNFVLLENINGVKAIIRKDKTGVTVWDENNNQIPGLTGIEKAMEYTDVTGFVTVGTLIVNYYEELPADQQLEATKNILYSDNPKDDIVFYATDVLTTQQWDNKQDREDSTYERRLNLLARWSPRDLGSDTKIRSSFKFQTPIYLGSNRDVIKNFAFTAKSKNLKSLEIKFLDAKYQWNKTTGFLEVDL